MGYTDLIFDLYGTLVDIHTEKTPLVWEKTSFFLGYYGVSYPPEELALDFQQERARQETLAGRGGDCYPDVPFEKILELLIRKKGANEDAATLAFHAMQLLRICSIEYIRLYPGTLEALRELHRAGYRLWLLSNAQQVFTAYEMRLLGLGPQFDGIYLSSDFGCCKPDSRFYHALLQEQGLDPAGCLMIGNDRNTDIAGARKLGMATLYMHTNLTPWDQAPAQPGMLPGQAPEGCRHFEFEGADWAELARIIRTM